MQVEVRTAGRVSGCEHLSVGRAQVREGGALGEGPLRVGCVGSSDGGLVWVGDGMVPLEGVSCGMVTGLVQRGFDVARLSG